MWVIKDRGGVAHLACFLPQEIEVAAVAKRIRDNGYVYMICSQQDETGAVLGRDTDAVTCLLCLAKEGRWT